MDSACARIMAACAGSWDIECCSVAQFSLNKQERLRARSEERAERGQDRKTGEKGGRCWRCQ